MAEKKTFKNMVDIDCRIAGWAVEVWNDTVTDGAEYVFLSASEWDLEVTFTKKATPVVAGSLVQLGRDTSSADEDNPGHVIRTYGEYAWLWWDVAPEVVQRWFITDLRVVG